MMSYEIFFQVCSLIMLFYSQNRGLNRVLSIFSNPSVEILNRLAEISSSFERFAVRSGEQGPSECQMH
jgi:hypothetical protein